MTPEQKNNFFKTLETGYNMLSIQVCLNGLSFCIVNCATKKVIYFQESNHDKVQKTPLQLLELLKKCMYDLNLTSFVFQKIVLIHYNEFATIVPKSLFSAKELRHYLKFNLKISENDYITFDTLENYDLVNVYLGYEQIIQFLQQNFSNFSYIHFDSIFIKKAIGQHRKNNQKELKILLGDGVFHIIGTQNKNLIFHNSFIFKTKEEFVYYVMFTIEELKLNPEMVLVSLGGNLKNIEAYHQLLYPYIKNVCVDSQNMESYIPENWRHDTLLQSTSLLDVLL